MNNLEDLAAERSVLAACVKSANTFLDISGTITPSTFTDEINQIVWASITDIYNDNSEAKVDVTLIRSHAKDLGLSTSIENVDAIKYIKGLFDYGVEISNVKRFAGKIRKMEIARSMHDKLGELQSSVANIKGSETADQIIAMVENGIFDFTSLLANNGTDKGYMQMGEGAIEYYEYLVGNPRDLLGISSGFPLYDTFLGGGLQRGCVNVVGARSGIGKSMVCENVALHVAGKLGIPTLYLDTEMDNKGHWHRIWANLADVPMDDIKSGKVGQNEFKDRKMRETIAHLENIPYHYANVSGKSFEEILAYARRWLMREVGKDENGATNNCLVIYDYIKLMTSEGLSNDMKEYQMLGFQMTGLHNFAIKHDLPILSCVQLNRDGITKDGLESISQSDRISWLASSVSIYKKKSDDEIAETIKEGTHKLVVLKSRHGRTNDYGEYINMRFDGPKARIVEGSLATGRPEKKETKEIKDKDGKTIVLRKKKKDAE